MRYLVAILALLALVGGLAAVKYKQISSLISANHAMEKAGPPPEAVGSFVSRHDTWQESLDAVGSIAPAKGVTLSNDAPGVVSAIHFESGAVVRQGQVLLDLDSNVERSQLASVEARKELAQVNATRTRALVSSDAVARSQQDTDDSVVKTSRSDLDVLQAQIARKVVRAPFSGRLGIRQVNLGQYLNSGTAIATLESTNTVFVDFTLPQQRLRDIALGMPVRVTIEGEGVPAADGSISAVDPTIDAVTRSIKLRASVPNGDEKLLPGMFAKVSVLLPGAHDVVIIPVSALVHAAYGDSIFMVEDSKDGPGKTARQQFVKVSETRGDFVAVSQGLAVGQEVVSAGAFKLRNGAPIAVDNAVQPRAELSPHPENR
jgi:membrane fusion protein (multidrug efflux system)